jgi:type 1 fimbria pilin
MNSIWRYWSRRMSSPSFFAAALMALAGCFSSTQIHAEDWERPTSGWGCSYSPSPGMPLSFGKVSVPSNAPVGSNIGAPLTLKVQIYCPSYQYVQYIGQTVKYFRGYFINLTPKLVKKDAMVSDVWETNIPGVGLRFVSSNPDAIMSKYPSESSVSFGAESGRIGSTWQYQPTPGWTYPGPADFTITITLQLVKTAEGAATAGSINMPQVLQISDYSNGPKRRSSSNPLTISIGNSQITPATCSVATTGINVTLPDIAGSKLGSAGAVAGKTPFTINLSCPTSANVFITLTDATAGGNRDNILSLAPESRAAGVGLQLMRNDGSPIKYGPDSAAAGNTNQWRVGQMEGAANIPLSVQYIATGAVTPGSVRARATFTMSYQ